MEKYKILCDYQEDFESESDYSHINDHQTKETFIEIEKSIKALGYQCEIFGGVPELLQAQNSKPDFTDTIFLNLSDGLSNIAGFKSPFCVTCWVLNIVGEIHLL